MQITIDFSQVSVPTPEPFDKTQPDKQRENLAFVALQVAAQAQQQGVKVTYSDDDETPIGLRLDGIEKAAHDLKWNGQIIDILGLCRVILSNRTASIEWGK